MSNKTVFTSSNISSQKKSIPNRSKKTSNHVFLKFILLLIWIIVVFFLSVGMISWFKWFFDTIKQSAIFSLSNTIWTPMKKDQYNSVNVLLLGYGWAGHQWWFSTDSITVASWNPEENSVVMISVPRDLRIKSPINWWEWKINSIFPQYHSKTKSIEESALWLAWKLKEILWLDIPYYATIDFQTFKEVVDAIWWVDIYVDKTIKDTAYPDDNMKWYTTFYIESGEQHLDWETALKYARSRHWSIQWDIDRAKRQQKLVIAIKDKMLDAWLNISTASDLYEQYKKYVQTNITAPEILRTVQFLPKIKSFSSFGYTPYCSYTNINKMAPWCFLREPTTDSGYCMQNGQWTYCQLPDGATRNNKWYYDEMKSFVTFLLTHRSFLNEWASVEVVNAISKPVLNQYWLWNAWVATKFGSKMVRYWLNVTNVANGEASDHSYITINMVWDFSWTIDAIQTFLPIQDIRVDTWSVQTEYDSEWNFIEYWTNRAYLTVTLWDDFVLWNEYFSWLSQQKLSYTLDIDPIPPLQDSEDVEVE